MATRDIKVLIAKPGLDGHDRGAKVVARALRENGMEVVYTGIRQTPEMIVNSAVELGVDVVGLSILSGAHGDLFPRILEGLQNAGMSNVLVIAGGIIPDSDKKGLEKIGVAGVFGPGTSTRDVIKFIEEST
ncbi:MAG: methylmalonyl-CoA mutase [Chloroflexi bacterium]|jgi:methylmalonyl-CoA mutase C-terminal domain/subunit|nr:methylmalonyl-CoA mutase [Chloroflexota bacterium]HAE33553.1 methylmalonyl-CoA mutase [Dehalococcoidia bacterium]|tara:strand:- start:686 stop:1078 length:393 start_codon:yes stop_codon:yes gene_type:complete